MCKTDIKWNLFSLIFINSGLLIGNQPILFPGWSSKGVHTLGDVFDDNGLCLFQNLCDIVNLPGIAFYFYLQLRSSMGFHESLPLQCTHYISLSALFAHQILLVLSSI